MLAAACEEDVVDILTDPPVKLDHSGELPRAVAWSQDGLRLATGTESRVRIWDTTTWQLAAPELDASASALAWRPDGTELATGGDTLCSQIWCPTSGDLLRSFPENAELWSLQWLPDQRTLALFGFTGDPYLTWLRDTTNGDRHELPELMGLAIIDAVWSPDGQRIAIIDDDDRLLVVERPRR
ncbi:MAG: WD40 repeat domain-containing protein [Propionibacteriaceae bacterium]|nr:WD40 repeat domain-containing protein [Propionibacteriaceae bacterium]